MAKVLVSDSLSEVGVAAMRDAGLDVDVNTGRSEDELVELIKSYDALIVRSGTKVTARILAAGERLKVVGRAGVGVDNVDVAAASRKGVLVMNTPLGNITSAAEHTVALLLALARNVPAADGSMKRGLWEKKKLTGVELRDKLLGLIGLGKVGQIVARAGQGMGMKVIACDPFLPERRAKELSVEMVGELDELLARADFITLHTPLTEKTRGLIGEAAFEKMKPSARLVNCARGGIVDEVALCRALEEGKIAGAALDVFEKEPLPEDSPLRSAPNLTLTPHLGASTAEAQVKVAEAIAHQVAAFFKEGKIQNAVNLSVTLTPELEPFANLAATLGRLVAQLLSNPPLRMKCTVRGKIAGGETRALCVSALQGLLSNWVRSINLVNAPLVAEERGITVSEETSLDSPDYANLVRVEVDTGKRVHSAAGTVFEGREPRIAEVDGFDLDLKPGGIMLVMFYPDKPGMVGKFGTILGNARINIAGMDVGRKEKRGRACMALCLDDPVPPDVIAEITACTDSGEAYLVNL